MPDMSGDSAILGKGEQNPAIHLSSFVFKNEKVERSDA
jgi:hypothetical protein